MFYYNPIKQSIKIDYINDEDLYLGIKINNVLHNNPITHVSIKMNTYYYNYDGTWKKFNNFEEVDTSPTKFVKGKEYFFEFKENITETYLDYFLRDYVETYGFTYTFSIYLLNFEKDKEIEICNIEIPQEEIVLPLIFDIPFKGFKVTPNFVFKIQNKVDKHFILYTEMSKPNVNITLPIINVVNNKCIPYNKCNSFLNFIQMLLSNSKFSKFLVPFYLFTIPITKKDDTKTKFTVDLQNISIYGLPFFTLKKLSYYLVTILNRNYTYQNIKDCNFHILKNIVKDNVFYFKITETSYSYYPEGIFYNKELLFSPLCIATYNNNVINYSINKKIVKTSLDLKVLDYV